MAIWLCIDTMKELRPLANFTEQGNKIRLKYIVPFDFFFESGGCHYSLNYSISLTRTGAFYRDWKVLCISLWASGRRKTGCLGNVHLLILKYPWKKESHICLESFSLSKSFPGGASDKESACQCRRRKRHGFNPWVRKIPWRRAWQPTSVFLPRESHGQRSLAGYSP